MVTSNLSFCTARWIKWKVQPVAVGSRNSGDGAGLRVHLPTKRKGMQSKLSRSGIFRLRWRHWSCGWNRAILLPLRLVSMHPIHCKEELNIQCHYLKNAVLG